MKQRPLNPADECPGGLLPRERGVQKVDLVCAWLGVFRFSTMRVLLKVLDVQGRDLLPKMRKEGYLNCVQEGVEKAWFLTRKGARRASKALQREVKAPRKDALGLTLFEHDMELQRRFLAEPKVFDLELLRHCFGDTALRSRKIAARPDLVVETVADGALIWQTYEMEPTPKDDAALGEKIVGLFEVASQLDLKRMHVSWFIGEGEGARRRYEAMWAKQVRRAQLAHATRIPTATFTRLGELDELEAPAPAPVASPVQMELPVPMQRPVQAAIWPTKPR